jgi:hypothetical protein
VTNRMFGPDNPQWKVDMVGYGSLHDYVKFHLSKPDSCQRCAKKTTHLDVANKSGEYRRDFDDWEWICRKCHMDSDGRNEQLRTSGQSRKLPDKECVQCHQPFFKLGHQRHAKFCGRRCFEDYLKVHWREIHQGVGNRKQQTCGQCHQEFANSHLQKFCSISCQAMARVGKPRAPKTTIQKGAT